MSVFVWTGVVQTFVSNLDLIEYLASFSYRDLFNLITLNNDPILAIKRCVAMPLWSLMPIYWGYLVFAAYMGVMTLLNAVYCRSEVDRVYR